MIRLFVFSLLFVPAAFGHQASPEEEAYTKLVSARDLSRTGNGRAARRFESLARAFLAAHKDSPRCADVRAWLQRIAFRYEAPPQLAVDRWIGPPLDPAAVTGKVKLLVFFSCTHPQTRKVLPRVNALRRDGVEIAGIAAVVDDHASQHPDALAKRLASPRLPFPVAIDKQRKQRSSISLERYRCGSMPWVVLIDRYGRIAWAGGVAARSVGRVEGKLDALLAQPTYRKLHDRVVAGDVSALKTLRSIRTVTTASHLLNVVARANKVRLHEATLTVLRKLMPRGYLDRGLADALGRWPREKRGVRFSFPANRLVRKR